MGNICTCDEKRAEETAAPLTLGKAKKKQPIQRDDSSSKLIVPAQPPPLDTPKPEPEPEHKAEVEAALNQALAQAKEDEGEASADDGEVQYFKKPTDDQSNQIVEEESAVNVVVVNAIPVQVDEMPLVTEQTDTEDA